jgi:hypothetical protein
MDVKTAALLADLVLFLHFGIVAFVVIGFVLILFSLRRNWFQRARWIRSRKFRWIHFCVISFVALQAVFGRICSLTLLESNLREAADQTGYDRPFVVYWISRILYWDFPSWVFTMVYVILALTALGLLFVKRN